MGFRPTHVVFSPPRVIDGQLYRGVVTTDGPQTIHHQMDRRLWTVILFFHFAATPRFEPEADLYFCDPSVQDQVPQPRVLATNRDFIREEEFYPLHLEPEYDVVFNVTWMPVKRHEMFLDALRFARDAGRPIRCLWFGYHYNDEALEREQALRDRVAAEELDITFAETDFNIQEVNRRYNLCRTALICSEYEGGPRVMGEALLAGVPYVVTEDTRGGSPQAVVPEIGRVCPPNGDGIASAIWSLLDVETPLDTRGWALEHMCLSKTLQRVGAAVKDLAESRKLLINTDIDFPGYDWEGKSDSLRVAEHVFLQQHPEFA